MTDNSTRRGGPRLLQRVLALPAVLATALCLSVACGHDNAPSMPHEGAPHNDGDPASSPADSSEGELTAAAAYGLNLRTVNSKQLCDALRLAVNDTTFGRPITDTRVEDSTPGEDERYIGVYCDVSTDPVEVHSDPSGGGTESPGIAHLELGPPLLDSDNQPQSQPVSFFKTENNRECEFSDEPKLNTATVSVWCSAASGYGPRLETTMYFTDMMIIFQMSAPPQLNSGLTKTAAEDAQRTVLAALSKS